MIKLLTLNTYIYLGVILLSLFILLLSQKGYLSNKLKLFCNHKSLGELFVLFVVIIFIILLLLDIILVIHSFILKYNSEILFMDDNNTTINISNTQVLVRWWRANQTWIILGTALGIYQMVPGTPKVKATAVLTSLGISIPSAVYLYAVENTNGFNRLMFSWLDYKNTGNWPNLIPDILRYNSLNEIVPNLVKESSEKYTVIQNSSSFLPKGPGNPLDYIYIIPEFLKSSLLDFFRPVPVEGHLDDLIGQQLFIHILLLMVVTSLIILFTIYLVIQLLNNNREFLINKFNNKFIRFYFKYQLFLAKISMIILPIIILFGLIEMFVGVYFLLTHPIPYEKLDIDLHTFIK